VDLGEEAQRFLEYGECQISFLRASPALHWTRNRAGWHTSLVPLWPQSFKDVPHDTHTPLHTIWILMNVWNLFVSKQLTLVWTFWKQIRALLFFSRLSLCCPVLEQSFHISGFASASGKHTSLSISQKKNFTWLFST